MAAETHITDVVGYVETHSRCTLAAIANHLDIKERTARSYIQRANNMLQGFAAIEYVAAERGYELRVRDTAAYSRWKEHALGSARPPLPSTPEGRVGYLLMDLLFRTDWVTLDDLANILFVSRASISSDLKRVDDELGRFDLSLERKPHYGIRVVGSEMNRRLCIAGIVASSEGPGSAGVDSAQGAPIEELFSSLGAASDPATEKTRLHAAASCVDDAAAEADFTVNSAAYQNLIVHIAVAMMRIEEGCYVPLDERHVSSISDSESFAVASRTAELIKQRLGLELPREEIAYMAIHLAGKQTLNKMAPAEDNLVIDSGVWDVVTSMLNDVWGTFRFDFRHDLELRMNLARHIVPLSVRMRYHMELKNPLLDSIKTRYPLAWSMALETAPILEKEYGSRLSEDERGYIALAFALALERDATNRPKKRLLVVCASGAGTSRLLEYRCRKEFSDWIGDIETCDAFHLDNVDFSQIDYVFTTVHIDQKLPAPICELHNFLDAAEAEQLRDVLRKGHCDAPAQSVSFFSKDLFFTHAKLSTKDEVLEFLLGQAREKRGMDERFCEAVRNRETVVATSLGNDVAMPHPVEATSAQTFGIVALLDEPVAWDDLGHTVRAVFLMSFSRSGGRQVQALISTLAELMSSPSAMATLVKHQEWETFCALLGAIESDESAAESRGTLHASGR
uniref:BglG family transcription antiterminator n=1 Tax=Parolsenella massiliensis TaxID=1871022 RepID=UPI0009F89287|nr:BglG family transcription antiterminator [Parolsenella massiliensis]